MFFCCLVWYFLQLEEDNINISQEQDPLHYLTVVTSGECYRCEVSNQAPVKGWQLGIIPNLWKVKRFFSWLIAGGDWNSNQLEYLRYKLVSCILARAWLSSQMYGESYPTGHMRNATPHKTEGKIKAYQHISAYHMMLFSCFIIVLELGLN